MWDEKYLTEIGEKSWNDVFSELDVEMRNID